MPRFEVDEKGKLLDFLRRKLPGWKATTLRQRLKNGLVELNGRPAVGASTPVGPGDAVEILVKPARPDVRFPPALGEPPLPILYADEHLLAVDKPTGLLSVATEREKSLTAVRVLRDWLAGLEDGSDRNLHAAHRLDRDASGVLLFARSLELKRRLAADWRGFEKVYLALVDGFPPETEGRVDAPLWEDRGLFVRVAERGGGESALTHYRLLRARGRRSLLEVRLDTGRKHQIRVHLAHIGCPIVGDVRYGGSKAPRLALHAASLRLRHPADGRELVIKAETPAWFKKALR